MGDAGIVMGLAGSIVAMAMLIYGRIAKDERSIISGTRLAWVIVAGAILSFVALERALITRDFTVRFVFENGSHRTPPLFNFATAWAALEGTIVLLSLIHI